MPSAELLPYLVYLGLWRLAVVLCGALSIYLGYKLFALGLHAAQTEMAASGGGMGIKVRNMAPGTAFALFGACVIVVMITNAPAEIEVVATPVPSSLAAAGGPEEQIRVKLRGGPASPGGLIVQDE
jgi:hypothetical protein